MICNISINPDSSCPPCEEKWTPVKKVVISALVKRVAFDLGIHPSKLTAWVAKV